MPILPNVRHERFAKAFVRGIRASDAYRQAGYTHKPNSVWACSSRLLGQAMVKRRIDELRAMQGVKHRITVDSLLSDLAQDRDLARRLEQPGAALQATQLMAKLTGFLVDRKETGLPGDFAALQTRDDVIARVRQEMGDEAVVLLEQLLIISDAPAPSGDDVN
jgi:hypothetical protein